MLLKEAGHDVEGYENMHYDFYSATNKLIRDIHKGDPPRAQRLQQQLHVLSESESDHIDRAKGVGDVCLLLSTLPDRFTKDRVRAGTIFIDTFDDPHRFTHKHAHSCIYCMNPLVCCGNKDLSALCQVPYKDLSA